MIVISKVDPKSNYKFEILDGKKKTGSFIHLRSALTLSEREHFRRSIVNDSVESYREVFNLVSVAWEGFQDEEGKEIILKENGEIKAELLDSIPQVVIDQVYSEAIKRHLNGLNVKN